MSRNSGFILTGTLWTLTTTLLYARQILFFKFQVSECLVLLLGLTLTSVLFFIASHSMSRGLSAVALFAHTTQPLLWVAWVGSSAGLGFGFETGLVLLLSACFGAGLSDLSFYLEDSDASMEIDWELAGLSCPPKFAPRLLTATDSGQFRTM